MANLILTMLKALVKSKLRIGKLTGMERFMLSQVGLPDRIPTFLAATNIEPYLVDAKYNYQLLTSDPGANLELFDRICRMIQVDIVAVPVWMGFLFSGAAELGTVFKIEKDRVPYAVSFPIQEEKDIAKITVPKEPTGYLKMYFDITAEAQKRHPDKLLTVTFDGPWDLAMLLRGDDKLPFDLRIHKDYVETEDTVRKKKIRARGNPDIYPAIMELTTQLAIRHIEFAQQQGFSLTGSYLVDQYAACPIMSRSDFVNYVLPYIEKVWLHTNKKIGLMYPCTSPMQMRQILENEPPGIAHQIHWGNYIFPTTPKGISQPDYDQSSFELARKYKKNFMYFIHGKFLRDASEQELETEVKRVCTLATSMRTSVAFVIASVPPGTEIRKVNFAFNLVEKYGKY